MSRLWVRVALSAPLVVLAAVAGSSWGRISTDGAGGASLVTATVARIPQASNKANAGSARGGQADRHRGGP
ncbi:MAG TPA: hypothetical protein VHZ06_06370 [Marmoricola sp.]|nr:hypothetical protein [Marmoricola sp.]